MNSSELQNSTGLFIYLFNNSFILFLFIFGCIGSLLLRTGFLQLRRAGATLRCGAQASHWGGFSCYGAWASIVVARRLQQLWLMGSRTQAQQLWCMGLVAPRHMGSSWTRDRTRVPCIGRQILNHCATRKVLQDFLKLEVIFQVFFNGQQ